VNTPSVLELVKNINWTSISLDALLDFILSESKLLINSNELQGILINEFAKRFKEEYILSNDSTINSNNLSNMNNLNNMNNSSPRKKFPAENKEINNVNKNSFTSELIQKLISMFNLLLIIRNCFEIRYSLFLQIY
jgi:hypothetical protein